MRGSEIVENWSKRVVVWAVILNEVRDERDERDSRDNRDNRENRESRE